VTAELKQRRAGANANANDSSRDRDGALVRVSNDVAAAEFRVSTAACAALDAGALAALL